MLISKHYDKIVYAARNNNLDSNIILKAVKVLSDNNADKVELNEYIPYSITHQHKTINDIGFFYKWGLLQVPAVLLVELKQLNFLAHSVIELLSPVNNLDTGCKMIRFFKNHVNNIEDALYEYISCDQEKNGSKVESAVKIVNEIMK